MDPTIVANLRLDLPASLGSVVVKMASFCKSGHGEDEILIFDGDHFTPTRRLGGFAPAL
jgi:hypothetical protein